MAAVNFSRSAGAWGELIAGHVAVRRLEEDAERRPGLGGHVCDRAKIWRYTVCASVGAIDAVALDAERRGDHFARRSVSAVFAPC
jgi:hypothetical protein